jgi:hypothetical protein
MQLMLTVMRAQSIIALEDHQIAKKLLVYIPVLIVTKDMMREPILLVNFTQFVNVIYN